MDVPQTTRGTSGVSRSLNSFFYSQEVPYGLALVRIILPLVLLLVMVPRWSHIREFTSSDGAAAPLALEYGFQNFPPEPSGLVAVAMMTALIVTLVTSSLGWFTRPSLFVAFVLYTYLNMLDCLSTMTKYSVISSHLLLLLSLSHCGSVWSIDSLSSRDPQRRFPAWPRRLMQLFVGLIYLGAAFTKLHTDAFFTSDQLRSWLMTNVNHSNPLGEWLSLHPAVVVTMSQIAIIWQLVFVFVVWKPGLRPIVLGLGVMFHYSTTPLFGLYIFPLLMTTSYLCYLNEDDIERLKRFAQRTGLFLRNAGRESRSTGVRRPVPGFVTSGVTWAVLLLTSTLAGVAAEYSLDPYGERRTDGPHSLALADERIVAHLLERRANNRPVPITEEDMILSMDVGVSKLGGVLLARESTIRHNQPFFVQVTLTTPHPDLWLECQLVDPTGRLVDQVGQIVPRENLRGDWRYQLPASLPPADYSLVLRTAHKELARRPIALVPATD